MMDLIADKQGPVSEREQSGELAVIRGMISGDATLFKHPQTAPL